MKRRSFLNLGFNLSLLFIVKNRNIGDLSHAGAKFAALTYFDNNRAGLENVPPPANYVNVKNFGAKGDGYSDDSSAVQKAMATNKNVWFPAGTYYVGNLKLRSEQSLAGEGPASVLRQKVEAMYCISANLRDEGCTSLHCNISALSIRNLRFEGQAGNRAFDEHVYLLNLNGVSDVIIEDCQFIGYVGDGIYIGSGNSLGTERHNERVTIRYCLFDGVLKQNRNGISIIDGTDIIIDHCVFTRSGRFDMPGAIDLEPDATNDSFARIKRITIQNCEFRDIGAAALIAISLRPNDKITYPANNVTIYNCKGFGPSPAQQAGLRIMQNAQDESYSPTDRSPPLNLHVSDCYFEGIYHPFLIRATKGVHIKNTTFYKSPAAAALGVHSGQQRNKDITLVNVVFKQIGVDGREGGHGLQVYGNDRIKLERCTFEDCGAFNDNAGGALCFTGQCSSSYISLINTTIHSTLQRTPYGIRVSPTHQLKPVTNLQRATLLNGVSGNDFLPPNQP